MAQITAEHPELELDSNDKTEKMQTPSMKWTFRVCPVCFDLIESVASEWHNDEQYIEEWFVPIISKQMKKDLAERLLKELSEEVITK